MKVFLLIIIGLSFSGLVKSQTFNFTFNSDATGTPYVYKLQTTIKIIGIKITNIYYDNGTNNTTSFGYALVLSYTNTVTGSNIPSSGTYFYNYQLRPISNAKDLNNNTLTTMNTDNLGIPIATNSNSHYVIDQNSTYYGSASLLGYTSGQTYSDAATLARFGYNTLALSIDGLGMSAQTITSGVTILPITLKAFTAILNNGSVSINWITSMESSNSYFSIERSVTGNNFVTLQKIASKGDSNAEVNYSVNDYAPLSGISYYRLKQTDLDGNFSYSSIASVNNTQNINDKVNFYPTINQTNIINFSGATANKTLDVFSMSGAKVFSTTLLGTQVALPNLLKGMYIFKVTSTANMVQTSKYIQQ